MPKARPRFSPDEEKRSVAEWEQLLANTNLGKEDRRIAKLYFLEQIPQADIATEMWLERSTISRRISGIRKKIRNVEGRG